MIEPSQENERSDPQPSAQAETIDFRRKVREAFWDAKRKETDNIIGRDAKGVDEIMRESVTAFNVFGVHTLDSSEGHIATDADRKILTPWIDFGAPNVPAFRFVGQEAIFRRLTRERGVPEDVNDPRSQEALRDSSSEVWVPTDQRQTPEYTEWEERTEEMSRRIEDLLDDFYRGQELQPVEVMLQTFQTDADGVYRVMAGSIEEHYEGNAPFPSEQNSDMLDDRREQMAAFTEFLKEEYLKS